MSNEVIVYKGRDNTVRIQLGFDVSGDVITSEIRSEPSQAATLIATWTVSFGSDGSDGKLLLTLDELTTSQITAKVGFMDLKRSSGGYNYAVFDKPLEVIFREAVTT